mmetsp:Transcript_23229/g.71180  ORF Transcript_23229/g.71180 Transcript_23229/m.71180 type:complete len:633 (+) Transcript_23229:97-1995(+)
MRDEETGSKGSALDGGARPVCSDDPVAACVASALISDDDLAVCLRVLHALAPDGTHVRSEFHEPRMKPLRCALQPLLSDVRSKIFQGRSMNHAERQAAERELKKERHRREQRQRALERNHADKTRMRAERLKTLEALEMSDNTPRAPDGVVGLIDGMQPPLLANLTPSGSDDGHGSNTTALQGNEAPKAGAFELALSGPGATCIPLQHHRACYTCKTKFTLLHHFYSQLCPPCATLNWSKRIQKADLSGRIVLLTGARVKIGFCATLRLLRCGATVLATTRFPVDATARFSALPDFDDWSDRLHLYGIDLRDMASIERLCEHIRHKFEFVTDVINNACQTVRRPARYYAHLINRELGPLATLPGERRRLMNSHVECFGVAQPLDLREAPQGRHSSPSPLRLRGDSQAPRADAPTVPLPMVSANSSVAACVPSALWSQLPTGSDEIDQASGDDMSFPNGQHDINGQQLDLRTSNSWLLKLEEVPTHEAAEALAINALAPFVLNARMRPLLEKAPVQHRFVVNVSAMEGKFYRYKTPNHPHTNMAKAALNMMTRTCAEELAAHGIYMNSVDTGWINDENPTARAAEIAARSGFQTPLDELDAAARLVDPIISWCNGSSCAVYGKFLKDFRPTEW